MVLRSGYLALALKLQEAAETDKAKFKESLDAALAAATEPGPWKSFLEAGARHSASDMGHLQAIHDASTVLGAACGAAMAEAAASEKGTLKLVESVPFVVDIELREAFTVGRKIKLIAPGKGSSAWYTEAALKKAATDKIFHAGLPMRIDHPTKAEEAARPEGSVKDWGAVLGSDAEWLESYVGKGGKDSGPGLYSDIKPFSDHAQTIKEKGPFAGVSICANGSALTESGKPVLKDGVPVLKEFTSAEGADMVTRAGAGGLFLQEAALAATTQQEVSEMDAAELTALKESQAVLAADNKRLLERAIRGDAREEADRILRGIDLHEAIKPEVVTNVLRDIPVKDGVLDKVKFAEAVNAEAKRLSALASAIAPKGTVRGMGIAPVVEIDAKETERRAAEAIKTRESAVSNLIALGMTEAAAKASADRMVKGAA